MGEPAAGSSGSSSRPARAPGGARGRLGGDLALFAFALAVRLVLTALYSARHTTTTGLELGTLADNILAGRGFVWEFYGSNEPRTSFFPPFYPAFLALLKAAFGVHWVAAMQIVQAVAGAAGAVAARRLGARLLAPGLDRLAGLAVALWPPLVIYSAAAYSTTFEALGVTIAVLYLVDAGRIPALAAAARAGAVAGLLAYALPAFLGSLALAPLGFRAMGVGWRRGTLLSGVALLTALLVLAPWTARNALLHHRFIPVATNLGFNYLGGQNPYSRPHTNVLCGFDDIRWRVIDRRALETMNEADFDRSLLAQGLAFARDEPLLTARRCLTRLVYYWWGSPFIRRYNPDQGLANMILMSAVLPFFLVGLARAVRARRRFGLLLAVFAWQSLFYMHFAVRGRYAMPFHPLLLLVAVAGAAAVAERIGLGRRRRPREAA